MFFVSTMCVLPLLFQWLQIAIPTLSFGKHPIHPAVMHPKIPLDQFGMSCVSVIFQSIKVYRSKFRCAYQYFGRLRGCHMLIDIMMTWNQQLDLDSSLIWVASVVLVQLSGYSIPNQLAFPFNLTLQVESFGRRGQHIQKQIYIYIYSVRMYIYLEPK